MGSGAGIKTYQWILDECDRIDLTNFCLERVGRGDVGEVLRQKETVNARATQDGNFGSGSLIPLLGSSCVSFVV
jgi:hypothetical protein